MTAHRRTARALTLGAGACAAVGLYTSPWLIVPGLYTAAVLAWCAARYYAAHRRAVAEEAWERAYVLGRAPAPLNPCCSLADYGGGEAHDRKCTDLFHRLTANSRSTT